MIDRFTKPDRGVSSWGAALPDSPREGAFGPRHSVSPPTIDSSDADSSPESPDRPSSTGEDANGLARTLRELIHSLPRRPVESAQGTIESTPDSVVGAVTPTFEDPCANGRRVESERGVSGSELHSPMSGRSGPPAPGRHEDAGTRSESGESDRREPIAALSVDTTVYGRAHGEPAESQTAHRHEPGEGPIAEAVFSVDRIGAVEPSGARAAEPTPARVADNSSAGLMVAAITRNGELDTDLGRWTSRANEAVPAPIMEGITSSVRTPAETVAVGPVGPAARYAEGFDRTSGESASATSWSGSSDVDPLGVRPGAVSPADEGSIGIDLNPTNALLGQILDELRRQQQSAPIASGRMVYPER